jgi:hypothetical protein
MLAPGTGRLDEEGATMSGQPPAYAPFPPPQQPPAAYPAAPGNQAPAMAPGEATTRTSWGPRSRRTPSRCPRPDVRIPGQRLPGTTHAGSTAHQCMHLGLCQPVRVVAVGCRRPRLRVRPGRGHHIRPEEPDCERGNTVDGHARTISDKDGIIRQRELAIDDLRGDLEGAEACPDAVCKTLRAADEAAFNVAYDEMVAECV